MVNSLPTEESEHKQLSHPNKSNLFVYFVFGLYIFYNSKKNASSI